MILALGLGTLSATCAVVGAQRWRHVSEARADIRRTATHWATSDGQQQSWPVAMAVRVDETTTSVDAPTYVRLGNLMVPVGGGSSENVTARVAPYVVSPHRELNRLPFVTTKDVRWTTLLVAAQYVETHIAWQIAEVYQYVASRPPVVALSPPPETTSGTLRLSVATLNVVYEHSGVVSTCTQALAQRVGPSKLRAGVTLAAAALLGTAAVSLAVFDWRDVERRRRYRREHGLG